MDPKSCRQTPHWIIAMICSLPLTLVSSIQPQFCLMKMCFWADCFMFCWGLFQQLGRFRQAAAPGVWFSSRLVLQELEESFFLSTTWNIVSIFVWHFLWASLETLLSALNTASGAPFEELLCVWRWRWWSWCWGGAVLVAESHGWKEGGYFKHSEGTKLPSPSDPHMTE